MNHDDPASGENYWHYNRRYKMRARALRNKATLAEKKLWEIVRRKRLYGFAFTRQRPALTYVVDFMCKDLLLILEADGKIHELPSRKAYDAIRTKELEARGFTVLRFSNEEIFNHPIDVEEQIRTWIRGKTGIAD